MIKLSELQAMDHARGNNLGTVVCLVAILALPPFSLLFGVLFVNAGIDLLNEAKGTTEIVINCIFIAFGVAVVFFGLLVPVKIFKGVMAVKKNTYRIFRENDVIVDARKELSKAHVPDDGRRWLLVSTDLYALLLKDKDHFVHATGAGDQVIASGALG
ncbi:MAG: hypothetical protein IJB36_01065, partial [Clostridia bacterium]|nr:hypothetical protein [Clostridia bacterium]